MVCIVAPTLIWFLLTHRGHTSSHSCSVPVSLFTRMSWCPKYAIYVWTSRDSLILRLIRYKSAFTLIAIQSGFSLHGCSILRTNDNNLQLQCCFVFNLICRQESGKLLPRSCSCWLSGRRHFPMTSGMRGWWRAWRN